MKLEDVNAIVAKVFSLPESEITDESSPETFPLMEFLMNKLFNLFLIEIPIFEIRLHDL